MSCVRADVNLDVRESHWDVLAEVPVLSKAPPAGYRVASITVKDIGVDVEPEWTFKVD
jgi:hypothetical protein